MATMLESTLTRPAFTAPLPSTQTADATREPSADRTRAAAWSVAVHDDVTALLTALDGGGAFREERWEREGGGGGVSRLLTEGATFEKAGVNRSTVHGELPREALRRLGAREIAAETVRFFASGVSVVAHPRSPHVPTVHLNVRYFELYDADGQTLDSWFGGGTDLTPTYPEPADAAHFHRALARVCDGAHPAFHARFKPWCDEYFVNRHRDDETRGVGGIFFDHVRPGDDAGAVDASRMHAFAMAVGTSLREAYAPIVDRRRDTPYGEAERALQLERRGRYVEFNLLHDRGTHFGLQTNARVESVLMSLPPHACWSAAGAPAPGSLGARLAEMLVPRDWCAADLAS